MNLWCSGLGLSYNANVFEDKINAKFELHQILHLRGGHLSLTDICAYGPYDN